MENMFITSFTIVSPGVSNNTPMAPAGRIPPGLALHQTTDGTVHRKYAIFNTIKKLTNRFFGMHS
jgi:hypothetical protein